MLGHTEVAKGKPVAESLSSSLGGCPAVHQFDASLTGLNQHVAIHSQDASCQSSKRCLLCSLITVMIAGGMVKEVLLM